jgi:hypothetical protein
MCAQINMFKKFFFISILLLVLSFDVLAQNDSTKNLKVNNGKEVSLDTLKTKTTDTAKKVIVRKETAQEKHDAHKATIRSAIIPGWGQAYNHEYLKFPIVYGAISIPTVTFLYNNRWYQRTKTAYSILVNGGDTNSINPKLKNISVEGLQSLRTTFRKDRDYSVIFFLVAWALNVADATVFGHLKNFDVSADLSLQVQPDYNPVTKSPSLGLVFNHTSTQKKLLPANF